VALGTVFDATNDIWRISIDHENHKENKQGKILSSEAVSGVFVLGGFFFQQLKRKWVENPKKISRLSASLAFTSTLPWKLVVYRVLHPFHIQFTIIAIQSDIFVLIALLLDFPSLIFVSSIPHLLHWVELDLSSSKK
jgi:hypothetical protein